MLYGTDLECSRLGPATVLESRDLGRSRCRNMVQCHRTSRPQGSRSLFDPSRQLAGGESQAVSSPLWASTRA